MIPIRKKNRYTLFGEHIGENVGEKTNNKSEYQDENIFTILDSRRHGNDT